MNPEKKNLIAKKINIETTAKGIKYFKPSFSFPLFTNPITSVEIRFIDNKNITEK